MSKSSDYNKLGYTDLRNGVDFNKTNTDYLKYQGLRNDLIRDGKDRGAGKVSKDYLKDQYAMYASFLYDSDIIKNCQNIIGQELYPYALMHLISDEKTKGLAWHRDSYLHRGQQIGSFPATLKLGLYLNPVNKSSGVTGLIPGSYHTKINNRYIDYAYALINSPKANYYNMNAGDAAIWDGAVMHHRPKNNGQIREAVIFNVSKSKDYTKDHASRHSLLSEYNKLL